MEKIVIANLKMNLEEKEVENYIVNINKITKNNNLYIAPSFIYLNKYKSDKYNLTAQDVSNNKDGSFTGDISAKQLKSIGVNSVIIGHSERRNLYNETSSLINEKIKIALKNNLKVILCVGETEELTKENTIDFIINELRDDLKDVKDINNIIIAYEPVYLISSGKSIELNKLDYIYKKIKNEFNTNIVYGGSVNNKNIKEICNITDGVIVGKMSLNVTNFIDMIKKIQ